MHDNSRMDRPPAEGPDRQITIRRYDNLAEADRADAQYWRQLAVAERLLLVWRLSVEQSRIAGTAPREQGLCRSVGSIRRR